nr:xin actin-binding repeat-containing protein 2 isoform X5 [Syngnathus scovelli]
MYQSTVTQRVGNTTIPSRVMEESEICSMPGGLANARKQFQTQETTTSHVTQFHFQHSSVQEMSHSEMSVSSGEHQVVAGSQQLLSTQETVVSDGVNNLHCNDKIHEDEEEEFPRYTTKELRAHFERTIEEAAPHKPIKARVPKSELCTVCRRRVYPMDGWIVDRKKYHKSCFFCEQCKSKLSLGNYVSLHGHFFCLHHYKQLLKSKGMYNNELGQKAPAGTDASTPPEQKLEWRYSTRGLSSLDRNKTHHGGQIEATKAFDESKPQGSRISVVWPPQANSPKKAFKIEEDIQLAKPQWPPQDNSPKLIQQQHGETVPRSVL